jgi:aconitate hydratase
MIGAHMLKGKKIHPEVSFVIAPGSRQVLEMISSNGALSTYIAAGARIAETTCGFCIGNSQAPGTDCVSIRTSNRNFLGRSGTQSAKVYLTSVETAVASAITGKMTDPRTLKKITYKKTALPKKYLVDDKQFIISKKPNPNITVLRGPNIGEPPENSPLPEEIKGVVTIKVGDKITTDHIMPAGDKLKYRSNIPKYAEFVFAPLDQSFSKRALENKKANNATIIVGGVSYGQGSSREHAALCPMYLGVKAVIVKSFERIHSANLINFGILPLLFAQEEDYASLDLNDEVVIPSVRTALMDKKELRLLNKTKNREIALKYVLTDEDIKMILAGGKLNYLHEKK